jgi:hypothetical protein
LTAVIESFAGALSGGEAIPQQLTDMVSAMSSSPLMGGYTEALNAQESLAISWGLGIGSYLFIVAAALKIAAGIITRTVKIPELENAKE